jgi:hypothetical protein
MNKRTNILHVHQTIDRAKNAFEQFIKHNDPKNGTFKYRYSDLTVEANGIKHRFVLANDNIRGLEFDSLIIDSFVKMDAYMYAVCRSLLRDNDARKN